MTKEELAEIRTRLKGAREETIREVIRQAESFLTAQLQAGLASDLRAMTLAAILAAMLSFLIGASATILASEKASLGNHWATVAWMIVGFGYALRCAVQAAKPTSFDFAGSNPKYWVGDVDQGRTLIESLASQAAHYADGIACNAAVLMEGHRWQRWALRSMVATIMLALLIETVVVLSQLAKHGLPALN